jgi:hypothetical protein
MNHQTPPTNGTVTLDKTFADIPSYVLERPEVKAVYREYQLAQLKLLALRSPAVSKRKAYAMLYRTMKRWRFLDSIIARPDQLELFVLRRRRLIGYFLRQSGFRYVPEIKAWLYRPLEK